MGELNNLIRAKIDQLKKEFNEYHADQFIKFIERISGKTYTRKQYEDYINNLAYNLPNYCRAIRSNV